MKDHRKTSLKAGMSPQALDRFAAGTDPAADADPVARHRRHGGDIASDQRRANTGRRLLQGVQYGAAVLLATALVYEGFNAMDSALEHAPHEPAAMAKGHTPPPPSERH